MRSRIAIVPRFAAAILLVAAEMCAAGALLVAVASPAAAQFSFPFFNDSRQRRQQPSQFGWPWQQPQERREAPVDYSKAPPPRKRDTPPTTNVLVVGDAMADWLGFGLEEAFAETPEIGVTRKPRANRGLIKTEGRDAYDAVAAVREILAGEKPDFIVMMTGLADRQSIRERPTAKPATQAQPNQPHSNPPNPPRAQQAPQTTPPAEQPPAPPVDAEAPSEEQPAIIAPAESGPSGSTTHQFRSDKWAELYAKRIDETIAALKSKGVPVFWVGLPAIRGTRSTSDMVYLNDLYRGRAEKAGIIYVDIWDGFVDEDGNYVPQGPDFEGQIRRLRSGDGTYFTKAGARKLAHYVEREIRRVMLARGAPVAMPAPEDKETPAQAPAAKPGAAPARPVAGPVVPLTGNTGGADTLLGSGPARGTSPDPAVNRVLVKGDPVAPPTGRADNFAWPRPDTLPPSTPVTEPTPDPAALAPPAPGDEKPAAPNTKPAAAPKRPAARTAPPAQPFSLFGRDDRPRPPGSVPNTSGFWSGWGR
ncbi:MAG TPA: DUF459 domain-containing protein [Xanthobacteraceae bacterium]|nr:DUF459 domain-containing protein [Xanthobacteraceae bacterium]